MGVRRSEALWLGAERTAEDVARRRTTRACALVQFRHITCESLVHSLVSHHHNASSEQETTHVPMRSRKWFTEFDRLLDAPLLWPFAPCALPFVDSLLLLASHSSVRLSFSLIFFPLLLLCEDDDDELAGTSVLRDADSLSAAKNCFFHFLMIQLARSGIEALKPQDSPFFQILCSVRPTLLGPT